ncbi:peptidylprolyl isomerase RRD1 [Saccharomyces cerevisiae]|uniref:Serine/threonine-protein phosphatase 2A activator n=1 Tax=Saccharomyces cerevisiae (strain CEN.PK113-7D) TaxID=889517 RepID=N1P969_YEASC
MSLDRVDWPHATFSTPVKRIFDTQTTLDFQSSLAIHRIKYHLHKYTTLISHCSDPDPHATASSIAMVNGLMGVLDKLAHLIDETPPLPGPRRYGNLACREWHHKLDERLPQWLQEMLPSEYHEVVPELQYYLGNSFGSSTRLDYGTGHELSFMATITALDLLGMFPHMRGADVFLLFNKYYTIMRRLILTYTLEPAGSHGVWGLDDHFHLVYILGSSQWQLLDAQAPLQPREILDKSLVREYKDTNFYCQGINFINEVKMGPFEEHSPILYDIAVTVPRWSKVCKGLLKMYSVEVLKKFPVVQHFWFGTGFFPWVNIQNGTDLPVFEEKEEESIEQANAGSPGREQTSTRFPTSTSMPPPGVPPSGNSINYLLSHQNQSHRNQTSFSRDRLRR